jgi:hypothetical protein
LTQKIISDKFELSSTGNQIGEFFKFLSSLSEEDKTEMKTFGREIHQAIESGNFDPEKWQKMLQRS